MTLKMFSVQLADGIVLTIEFDPLSGLRCAWLAKLAEI